MKNKLKACLPLAIIILMCQTVFSSDHLTDNKVALELINDSGRLASVMVKKADWWETEWYPFSRGYINPSRTVKITSEHFAANDNIVIYLKKFSENIPGTITVKLSHGSGQILHKESGLEDIDVEVTSANDPLCMQAQLESGDLFENTAYNYTIRLTLRDKELSQTVFSANRLTDDKVSLKLINDSDRHATVIVYQPDCIKTIKCSKTDWYPFGGNLYPFSDDFINPHSTAQITSEHFAANGNIAIYLRKFSENIPGTIIVKLSHGSGEILHNESGLEDIDVEVTSDNDPLWIQAQLESGDSFETTAYNYTIKLTSKEKDL